MKSKRIGAYDAFTQAFVISGLLIMHLLVLGLCTFFSYQFLIISVDYSAILLICVLLVPLIVADILGSQHQTFKRFLLYYKISASGIEGCGLGWKSWNIPWDDIRIYGLTGITTGMPLLFFSKNPNDDCSRKIVGQIGTQKVVLQLRNKAWDALADYMPQDMKKRLDPAIQEKREIFLKR